MQLISSRYLMNLLSTGIVYLVVSIFVVFVYNSTLFAGYLTRGPISENHNDFYIGSALSYYWPTGPDQVGYKMGSGLQIRVGYQFMKYLSVEIGSSSETGEFNSSGLHGDWTLSEPVDLVVKPILPISKWDNIYLVLGGGYGFYYDNMINTLPERIVDFNGFIYSPGIGYERYLHDGHLSVSCALMYHYFTIGGRAHPTTFTLPYRIDRSKLAVEIWVFWRFFRNKE